MQQFQSIDQTQMLSYYQIAGIHGVPNIPWDGVQADPLADGAIGYCTHSSVVFPMWHRAYLALFEQVFYTNVQTVVKSFPAGRLQARYARAALSLRIPYWDWAAAPLPGQPTLPPSISTKYVPVTTPYGQQTILNPLFRYSTHPLVPSDMIFNPWASWPVSFRWPTSNTSVTAVSQNNLAVSAIENSRLNTRDNVYNLFTQCSNYTQFSNDQAASSTPSCHTSLESIHDVIHSLLGGTNYGHMTYLWFAAFDPIFFLHHA